MKDEIKEILHEMKQMCDVWVKVDGNMKSYNQDQIHKIYEYITNLQHTEDLYNQLLKDYDVLQQENERLKQPKIFMDTQDMEERYGEELYKDYLEKQVKDYKLRIDKAIEYITNTEDMCYYGKCNDGDLLIKVEEDFKNDLLNILNGEE